MKEPGDRITQRVARIWGSVVGVTALVLIVAGGALDNVRVRLGSDPAKYRMPVGLEPARGEYPEPPTLFRWEPGHPDAVAQLLLHRRNFEMLWSSPPLRDTDHQEIPLRAYEGVGAGEVIMWRVREALDGKPIGTSAYTSFRFLKDLQGYGPGEAPETYKFLD